MILSRLARKQIALDRGIPVRLNSKPPAVDSATTTLTVSGVSLRLQCQKPPGHAGSHSAVVEVKGAKSTQTW